MHEWESIDAFMDCVSGPHNMIELIEHLCERFDEENVCKSVFRHDNSSRKSCLNLCLQLSSQSCFAGAS